MSCDAVPYATLLQMLGPRSAAGWPSAPSSSIGSDTSPRPTAFFGGQEFARTEAEGGIGGSGQVGRMRRLPTRGQVEGRLQELDDLYAGLRSRSMGVGPGPRWDPVDACGEGDGLRGQQREAGAKCVGNEMSQ
ncbi:hypothetical protein ACFTY7_23555 [Streptomyces sp. NPDC057062]|uniref:hypothetical protein n=1 Tax=Streptomyces sp. NPDC057062 TaxID=3346011 RepID=UPI003627C6BE